MQPIWYLINLLAHLHVYILLKWIDIEKSQSLLSCVVCPIRWNHFPTNGTRTPDYKQHIITLQDLMSKILLYRKDEKLCADFIFTYVEEPE